MVKVNFWWVMALKSVLPHCKKNCTLIFNLDFFVHEKTHRKGNSEPLLNKYLL